MKTFIAVSALALSSSAALAGPDWVEQGDAGSTLVTAQFTRGVGGIRSITGRLSVASRGQADLEDLYVIQITQPSTFTFTMSGVNFSPAIFLFNITQANEAIGLLGNNADGGSSAALGNTANDATQAQVTLPGLYLLAITFDGRRPFSRSGDIFNFTNEGEVSGPDGQGGTNPLEGWDGIVPTESGDYDIDVVGVDFAQVPTPGSAIILAGGGAFLLRRRRR